MAGKRPSATKKPRKPRGPRGKRISGNGFTRRFSGPAGTREAHRRAQAMESRTALKREAWALLTGGSMGLTFQQIGERLGCSGKHAWVLCKERSDEILREGLADDALMLAKAQAQLDTIRRAIVPDLYDRKPSVRREAADTLITLSAREARLLGLDRTKVEGYTVEQVRSLIRGSQAALAEALGAVEAGLSADQRTQVEARYHAAMRRFAGQHADPPRQLRPAPAESEES